MNKIKKIKILALSSPIIESSAEYMISKIHEFSKIAENFGYKIYYNDKIFSDPELPFFAAKTEYMIEDFIDAINGDYDYIFSFRGGYGSIRIADYIIKNNIHPKNNALFLGFSDLTAIHFLYSNFFNKPSIHCPVLTSLLKSENYTDFFEFLTKKESRYNIDKIFPQNKYQNEPINSELIGGNLRVITSLVGSKLVDNFEKKILFLEDINEESYSTYRDLYQLKLCGIFEKIDAIIFAEFTNSDRYIDYTIEKFVECEIPNIQAYKMKNIGHVIENQPIFLNSKAVIYNNILKVEHI